MNTRQKRTDAEIATLRAEHRKDGCSDCDEQDRGGFVPRYAGSTRCESGSIASGGKNTHCTCPVCWG